MDKIRSVYDFIINYLILVSHDGVEYDFSAHMVEFTYNESIFSPVVYGEITVMDTLDYAALLPILGEERLKASFTRADENSKEGKLLKPIKFDLAVYKMRGRLNQNAGAGKAQTYTLCYTSDASYTNVGTKIFKKYKNMKYSDMVKKIHAEYLSGDSSKIEVEETTGEYSYYAQNISPFQTISNLAYKSVSKDGNGYNYVFYRDRDGYKFKTVSSIAKKDPELALTYTPKNLSENRLAELYSVSEYSDNATIDTLTAAADGELCSALLTVDPIRRKFHLKAFDLRGETGKSKHGFSLVQDSAWEKFPHMDKNKNFLTTSRMFTDPRSNVNMFITDYGHKEQEYIIERDADIYLQEPEFYALQTRSHFKQMQSKVLTVSLSGNPTVKAGTVIKFLLPEVVGRIGEKDPEKLDRYLQGKYVVTQAMHVLKNDRYTMVLKLIKDSYFNEIKSRDPVKENKGIY